MDQEVIIRLSDHQDLPMWPRSFCADHCLYEIIDRQDPRADFCASGGEGRRFRKGERLCRRNAHVLIEKI